MRKVLIIAHLSRTSSRILGLAKYLPEFGWRPVILTAPIQETGLFSASGRYLQDSVIEVPYLDLLRQISVSLKSIFGFSPKESVRGQMEERFGMGSPRSAAVDSLLRLLKEVLYYPDRDRAWKAPAVKMGSELLRSARIDVMISSSAPVTSHVIARELKDRYGTPWVADLQDLWSQNHNYPYSRIRNVMDRRLELKTLSAADALVTVSQPLAERLKKLHKGKLVSTITLGFLPEEMKVTHRKPTSRFTITYTGQIYKGKQDPSKPLAALRELISEDVIDPGDVDIRFYGYKEAWLKEEIERYGLSKIVRQYGLVSRRVALERQRQSQLLLLLNWENREEKGVYTQKVFEYLAAKRPIIATGGFGDDVIQGLLDETKAGFYAPSVGDVKRVIREAYLEYKARGEVSYKARMEAIGRYSYREKARALAKILDDTARKDD